MAEKTYRYFKLGTKATLFVDPKSGLDVTNKNITKILARKLADSKEVSEAIQKGHLIEVEEEEFTKWYSKTNNGMNPLNEEEEAESEAESDEDDPETWTKAQLIEWIEDDDNEVDDSDKKGLNSKKKEDLVAIVKNYKD